MIKKRKRQRYFKRVIFLIFLMIVMVMGVRQRETVTRYWAMLMLALKQKDARVLALSLRHEPLGILCVMPNADAAEECYVFDMKGVVFDRARTVVGEVIVKINEQSDIRPVLNTDFVPTADWQNLKPILEAVRDKKITVSRIALQRTDKELTLTVLPQAIPFYFSYEFNPRAHIDALPEFFKKVSLDKLQYVDLRIEGKIFYL